MNYEEARKDFAPCGIDCERCVSKKEGIVGRHSKELLECLNGFEKMAGMMSELQPLLKNYDVFIELLRFFSEGSCPGCRNGEGVNCACTAKQCHKERKVDFCFQCNEFPCDRNAYNEHLYQKWVTNNQNMKELGVEIFCEREKSKSRY
ncbi:MAG TPA: DUF3795 domain-containing protein [Lachnospiraceae bacterium]|nr:DUF3795 domain-containing protein [Lachnospiraceae bacterium]